MKLSTIPKKSLVAAVCAAPSLLWSLWIFFSAALPILWNGVPFYSFNRVLGIKYLLDLLGLLLGIILLIWFLMPKNRRYQTGLKVVLCVIIAHSVTIKVMVVAISQVDISQTVLSLLALLLGADAILLIGALAKKSTEKLAALSVLLWSLWRLISAIVQDWIPMSQNPEITTGYLAYFIGYSLATGFLLALLWAAALWLHPVLERPMLQPLKEEKE